MNFIIKMLLIWIFLSIPAHAVLRKETQNIVVDVYFNSLNLQGTSIETDELSPEYYTYTGQTFETLKKMKKFVLLDIETLNHIKREDIALIEKALLRRLELIESALACYEPRPELECEQSLIESILIESVIIMSILGLGALICTTNNNQPTTQ